LDLGKLLAATGQVKSRAEANRLITQGAVSIEGEKVIAVVVPVQSGSIIKVGKHRFVKIADSAK
jgi:tyrosyl-tRNA synthetase